MNFRGRMSKLRFGVYVTILVTLLCGSAPYRFLHGQPLMGSLDIAMGAFLLLLIWDRYYL